jgi:hypothetical protein
VSGKDRNKGTEKVKTKAQKKWIAGHSLGVGVDVEKEDRSVRRFRGTAPPDRQEEGHQGEAKRRLTGVEGGRGGLYSVDTVPGRGGFRPVPPAMPFERSKSAGTTHVIRGTTFRS